MSSARATPSTPPGLLAALWQEVMSNRIPLVAAGLAYAALFGLLPALAASVAVWDRFGNVRVLMADLHASGAVLPPAMIETMGQFLTSVPHGFGSGTALAVNLLLVTWTSYLAAAALLTALNVAYDVVPPRGFVWRTVLALMVGLAGMALLFVALAVMAVPPLLTRAAGDGLPSLLWLRWPGLAVAFAGALFLLFRFVPNRTQATAATAAWGAIAAAVLMLAASAGLSLYVAVIGTYGVLYGPLAGIAVVLLWFYVSALAILVGAELDATLTQRRVCRERQFPDCGIGP